MSKNKAPDIQNGVLLIVKIYTPGVPFVRVYWNGPPGVEFNGVIEV